MKKIFKALMLVLAVFTLTFSLAACGSKGLKDGTYTAEASSFYDGWKDKVTIEVVGGKIISADWNADSEAGGPDKKTLSITGDYKMKEFGNALAEWHEEVQVIEAELVAKQDASKIKLTSEGKADGVTGVTINVKSFVELAQKAIDQAK